MYLEGGQIRDRDAYAVDVTFDGLVDSRDQGRHSNEFRTLPLTRIPLTDVSGWLRDSESSLPIVGATSRVDAFPEAEVVADAEGKFTLRNMPATNFVVHVDGSTSTNAPAGYTYPNVGKPFHSIPGTTSKFEGQPITFDLYLPKMKISEIQPLSATEPTDVGFGPDGKARLQQMFPAIDPALWDEMKVTIAPGS